MSFDMSAKIDVERQESCAASLLEARTVSVEVGGERFDRWVETFALRDHPRAKAAYAWKPLGDGTRRELEYTIVLQRPGVNSADDALRTAVNDFLKSL